MTVPMKPSLVLQKLRSGEKVSCFKVNLAEAGGTVITTSRNLESAGKTAGIFRQRGLEVHPMELDQGDPASVQGLKEALSKEFEGLHVLVNNAVSRPMKGYGAPISQFAASMHINATGMMDLVREMSDLIIRSGGGSVISISSIHLADISEFDRYNKVYAAYFQETKPARITVQSVLAEGLKVEIDCIASIPEDR